VIATAEIALNLAKTISAINLAAAGLDAISFGLLELLIVPFKFLWLLVWQQRKQQLFSNANS
jgi:hypothetical protein